MCSAKLYLVIALLLGILFLVVICTASEVHQLGILSFRKIDFWLLVLIGALWPFVVITWLVVQLTDIE